MNLNAVINKFFNIEVFTDIKKAIDSISLLSEIKFLYNYLKRNSIDNEFLERFYLLLNKLRDQFDFAEHILELNINNELIKNIIFLQFTKCLHNENSEKDKLKRNNIVNNAYDDAIYFCNKVLTKRKTGFANIKIKKKSHNKKDFFEDPIKEGYEDIYVEIITLIKNGFKDVIIEEKLLKNIRRDATNYSIGELKVNNSNCKEIMKNIHGFLNNYKDVQFASLIAELQYEYCIFKAENTKWINYQENMYPISLNKRLPTEEKIKWHFIRIEDIAPNLAKFNQIECNENNNSDDELIQNKVLNN